MSDVTFADYRKVLNACQLPNVKAFAKQVEALRTLFEKYPIPPKERTNRQNMDYMLNLGHMFTMAPYAQLILEAAKLYDIEDEIINQMFSFYVTDMATYATKQLSSQENGEGRDALLLEIINTKPVHDKAEYDRIWDETILPLTDAYIINDATRYSTNW